FQFLARSEKTNAFLFRREQYAANECACCQDWPKRDHYYLKKAGEGRQRAERKAAEERLRQNAEDEKVDRPGDEYREEKTSHSKSGNEKSRHQKQREDVRQICDQQNRDQQSLR